MPHPSSSITIDSSHRLTSGAPVEVSHDRNDYGRRGDQSGRTRYRDEPEHGIEKGSRSGAHAECKP